MTAKLVKRVPGASKRESSYYPTEHGKQVTDIYGAIREEILVSLTSDIVGFDHQMTSAAAVLERMVSPYDQSIQAVLNHRIVGFGGRKA